MSLINFSSRRLHTSHEGRGHGSSALLKQPYEMTINYINGTPARSNVIFRSTLVRAEVPPYLFVLVIIAVYRDISGKP